MGLAHRITYSQAVAGSVSATLLLMAASSLSGCGDNTPNHTSPDHTAEAGADASGAADRPTYKLSDFDFSAADNATGFKQETVDAVNKLVRENAKCSSVDPDTLLSIGEKPSKNPEMQIVCNSPDGQQFATRFHALDAANGTHFAAAKSIDRDAAINECEDRIKAKLGAYDIAFNAGDFNLQSRPDGKTLITASLDYDRGSYRVICRFEGSTMIEATADRKPD